MIGTRGGGVSRHSVTCIQENEVAALGASGYGSALNLNNTKGILGRGQNLRGR